MTSTRITINPSQVIADVPRRLFGGFVEHLGRHIYGGIYEPGHPSANEDGFRTDVIELVRELGVSTIRYPGGNFVSGFRWEDSVGPRDERPARLDLAWHSLETNEVGLHEFQDWLDLVGSDMMLAVNLGTRGTLEALDLLEYTNIDADTALVKARRANGRQNPFDVRMWCLGNEMDGPWQLGHRSAEDYGKIAAQTARAMKQVDPDLELVVCGSSSAEMPTFAEWERTVLTHTYDAVEYISCHAYYEEKDGDLASFLGSATNMQQFISTVTATADHVKAVLGSDKTINVSFDEWNIWYLEHFRTVEQMTDPAHWPVAPPLLENVYTVADAVVMGDLLITLLRNTDRVRSASLAQLVNVIAPIMTENGGPAWRQTTFFPFSISSSWARGNVIDIATTTSTTATERYGDVPVVNAVSTYDEETGRVAVFLVNRSVTDSAEVVLDLSSLSSANVERAYVLSDDDPYAQNTREQPDRVWPGALDAAVDGDGSVRLTLPPVAWAAVRVDVSGATAANVTATLDDRER